MKLEELSWKRLSEKLVYKDYFGSWFKALIAAGVLPEGSRQTTRGTHCLAKDGHECLSLMEKSVDDWLYDNSIEHIREPEYPFDSDLNPSGQLKADKWTARLILFASLTDDFVLR